MSLLNSKSAQESLWNPYAKFPACLTFEGVAAEEPDEGRCNHRGRCSCRRWCCRRRGTTLHGEVAGRRQISAIHQVANVRLVAGRRQRRARCVHVWGQWSPGG